MSTYTDLNESEKKAIEELQERMEGAMDIEMYEDSNIFYRFLKAQDFDVHNAELMLRKHLRWFAKHDVKNIMDYSLPEVVQKYFPYIFLGYDKEGCVVRYSPIGNIDVIGILKCLKENDLKKSMIYLLEDDENKLKMKTKEQDKTASQCIYIADLRNLTFSKITNKKAVLGTILILKSYQNNYPGRIKAVYVINGSMFLSIVYNYLKLALGASLLSKFHLYYDDSWKKDLLKSIDADVLPAFLGGNRTDPDGDPLCRTFIGTGGTVPEKYYLPTSKKSLASVEGVKKIKLSRADFLEEILDIKNPGSSLEWEFETECRDIGFGVYYEDVIDGEKSMIELIPHQRIETEDCSETGMLICEKSGNYVFLFDNTYSWIRSKEIYYRIKVVPPKETAISDLE